MLMANSFGLYISGMEDAIFAREPEESRGLRDCLYLSHNYVDGIRGAPLITAKLNIPSRFIVDGSIYASLPEIHSLMRNVSGIDFVGNLRMRVECTFLLKNKYASFAPLRTFSGTVNTAYQEANIIHPFTSIVSVGEVIRLLRQCAAPPFLYSKLDSSQSYPDSSWEFAGVVSLVLVYNLRKRVAPFHRKRGRVIVAS